MGLATVSRELGLDGTLTDANAGIRAMGVVRTVAK